MRKGIRVYMPILVILAMLATMFGVALPALANGLADGIVNSGPGVLTIPDPIGDVGLPVTAPNGTISGWDMEDLRLAYDEATDTMYVGINTVTILGDADGNGDPSGASAWLVTNGGVDLPNLEQSETVAVYFDLDEDGTYDVIAGISGTTDYSGFSVNNFTGFFYPPYNFGAALPSHIGDISPNPSVTYPDLEFTVTNWTALPGHDDDPGFCVGAFLGSLQDDGIGEDYIEYCQSPCIDIEKTVDCNGDGEFHDEELWYAGDNATWKVVVSNCGGCNLTDVMITDSNGHDFGPAFNLSAGADPVVFNYTTIVSVNTTNNATVTAMDAVGFTVSDWDVATNNVISPLLCIEKTVDCNDDGIFLDEDYGYVGDTGHWKIVVTNCGNATLYDVWVWDSFNPAPGDLLDVIGEFYPGENRTYEYDTTVNNDTTNWAYADGFDLLGGYWIASDNATNYVIASDICIEKTVDCNGDGEFHDEEMWYAGDNATWKVVVTNCGGSNLTNVIVTDTNGHDFGAPFALGVGQNQTFTYNTVVSVNTTNNATVTATDLLSGTVSDWDIATNNVISPCLDIEKTVDFDGDGIFTDLESNYAGEPAYWAINVTNCGDSTVYDIYVSDDNNGADFYGPFDLGPGESEIVPVYNTTPMANFENEACAEGVDELENPVGPVCDTAAVEIIVVGNEGCTPGYWKNNADKHEATAWEPTPYDPDMELDEVFTIPSCVSSLANDTLLEALGYKGGKGTMGAAQILLRSAVAALLNASHPDINYYMDDPQDVIDAVNAALASCDRATMLLLYEDLDFHNNDGCVLDMYGNPIMVT